MKQSFINKTHIEGYVYEHKLEEKVSGSASKNPGTKFISGELKIATDNACINVVSVHFTYVTETTKNGGTNATYTNLKSIIDGTAKTIMKDGKDAAAKVRIDSALNLNEFYSTRNGKEELVSTKRNEGGFVHFIDALMEDEKQRNTFDVDILITGVTRLEANEERNIPEKVIVKGAIFDFRKALLPVEFTALNAGAMDYFEGLEATSKNPVFTHIWGRQVSETVTNTITEESAFGDARVRTVTNSRKDFVITGANPDPYPWDEESTLTEADVVKMIADRETYLATIKQRQAEYQASKNQTVAAPAAGQFNF